MGRGRTTMATEPTPTQQSSLLLGRIDWDPAAVDLVLDAHGGRSDLMVVSKGAMEASGAKRERKENVERLKGLTTAAGMPAAESKEIEEKLREAEKGLEYAVLLEAYLQEKMKSIAMAGAHR